jgi:carbonic anhydrase
VPYLFDPNSVAPQEALLRLVEGNARFLDGGSGPTSRSFRPELADRPQRPFAIVLGCSDSRMPVETVFDQGFGDLFVVRVAGHVVAPSIVGSIEFAASQFGTRLVVVLGHTRCGAIAATVEALRTGDAHRSRNIRSITDRIAPHIEDLVKPPGSASEVAAQGSVDVARLAMRANVRASTDHLRHGSRLLEELVLAGRISILGAEYELETGRVNFLDGLL